MKRTSKIVCVLAMVIILCMTVTALASAAQAGSIWSSVAPAENGTDTAALIVTNTTVTDGLVTLTYDPAKLSYQEILIDSSYVAVYSVNSDQAGTLVISWIAPSAYAADGSNITLLQVLFTGTDAASLVISGEAHGSEGAQLTLGALNTAALKAAVTAAEALQENAYTPNSWAGLKTALDAAKAALAKADASQAELDSAAAAVTAAVEALQARADLTALDAAIKAAEALRKADYTSGSWAALDTALKAAKETQADLNTAQATVDAAVTALKDATAALVDITELAAAIQTAEALKETDYSPNSWAAVPNALKAAKDTLAKAAATQAEVDAAATALKAALNALGLRADFTALEAAVTAAQALKKDDYTADSWAALEAALEKAGKVLADMNATQAEVDAAAAALDTATKALQKPADTAALAAAIKAAEALKQDDYTAASWAGLSTALDSAKKVLADPNATQAQIDAAAAALDTATKALQKAMDPTSLEAAIQVAKKINKDGYTEESYQALQKALAEAEALLADASATQAQLDEAAKALNAAIDSLVRLPDQNPDTGDTLPVMAVVTVAVLAFAFLATMLHLNKRNRKRFLAFCLVLCMVSAICPRFTANAVDVNGFTKLDPDSVDVELGRNPDIQHFDSLEAVDPNAYVKVIIYLEEKSVVQADPHAVLNTQTQLQINKLEKQQNQLLSQIESQVLGGKELDISYQYTWLVNGVATAVPYGTLDAIRAMDGVQSVVLQQVYSVCQSPSIATPNTTTDGVMIGREPTWANGYTGEGMKIAIIDTGLDIDHPNFAALPEEKLTDSSATEATVAEVLDQLNASSRFEGLTAADVYHSSKVAFGFNYCDNILDVTHDADTMGDHGTHVAGIAAANKIESSEVVGVAPDAQLYIMKVFGQKGGAYTMDILAALEDALMLGADVINMSLGSPAGFTSGGHTELGDPLDPVYESVASTGTILSVSAGNNYTSGLLNTWGNNLNTTDNPDNGVVGAPGTYANTMTVASVENWKVQRYYIDIDGYQATYNDSSNGYSIPSVTTLTEEYQVVAIPGYGEPADYEGLDVTGKVVLVQRGVTNFTAKHAAAEAAGAVAMLVYNNTSGEFGMDMTGSNCVTPAASITMADGEYLLQALQADPALTISFPGVYAPFPSSTAYEISDFSSAGPAPDLTLAPDITAPGGNIYSTVNDGQYGLMSGTSMAAPNIAGITAIVMQYVKANFPEGTDYRAVTQNLLMSTSVPLLYTDSGVPYSPRSQGSGLANAFNAVTSQAYLTVTGADNVKADLGDDAERTGSYAYSFNVHNFSTAPVYYRLHTNAQTEAVLEDMDTYFMSGTPYALEAATAASSASLILAHDVNNDGVTNTLDAFLVYQAYCSNPDLAGWEQVSFRYDLNADEAVNTADAQAYLDALVGKETSADLEATVLQVNPGETAVVDVQIDLTEADKTYLDTYFTNGGYVEGFTFLTALQEGGVDLSLPYLAFYGSWTEAPVLDTGSYWEIFDAEEGEILYNQYAHVLFTQFQGEEYGMYPGLNPYIEEPFDMAHTALSPNGDGQMDSISDIYISLMRNAKNLQLSFTDMDTDEVYFGVQIDNVAKSVYYASYGSVIPFAYDLFVSSPELFDWKNLENNTRILFKAEVVGVAEGDEPETWEVPITVDIEAPELLQSQVTVDPETGRTMLNLTFRDNQYVAALVLLNSNNKEVYAQNGIADPAPGPDGYRTYTYSYDITDISGKLVLAICDYAANESFYALNAAGAGQPYGDLVAYQYNYFYGTNGWVSFNSDVNGNEVQISTDDAGVVAAEYINGYVFVQDETGALYGARYEEFLADTMAPELTFIAYLENVYQDLAYNYADGKLYGLLTFEDDYGYPTTSLYSINLDGAYYDEENATDVEAYEETWVAQYGSIYGLTMAIDDNGTFYIMANEYIEAYDPDTWEDTSYYSNAQLWTVNAELIDRGWYSYMSYTFAKLADTDMGMDFLQSMTWDHNEETLYWARFYVEGWDLYDELVKIDPATGECTVVGDLSGETFALFAPLTEETAAKAEHANVPAMDPDVIPTPILRDSILTMSTGSMKRLICDLDPWYTSHTDLVWSSSDETVATVNENGVVTAVAAGSAVITVASADDETKFDTVSVEVTALTLSFQGLVTNQGAGVGAALGVQMYEFSMDAGTAQMTYKDMITAPTHLNFGLSLATSEMGRGYIWACEYGNTGMVYKIDPNTGEVVDYLEPIDGDMLFGMHYSEAMDSFSAIMNMYLYVDQPFESWATQYMIDSYDEDRNEFMWRKLDMLPYLIESNTGFVTGEDGNGASSEIVFCGITGIDGGIMDSTGQTYYYDTYKDYMGNWVYSGMMNYQPTQTLILLDNVGRIWYIDEIAGMTKTTDEYGNVFLTDDNGSEIMYEGQPRNGMIELEIVDPEGNVSYSVFNIRKITETPMTQMFREGSLPRITYHFSDIEFAGYTQENDPMLAISMYDYWNNGTTNELYLYIPGHDTDEMDYETWEPIRTPDRLYSLGNTGNYSIIASIHSATVTGGVDPEAQDEPQTRTFPTLTAGIFKKNG